MEKIQLNCNVMPSHCESSFENNNDRWFAFLQIRQIQLKFTNEPRYISRMLIVNRIWQKRGEEEKNQMKEEDTAPMTEPVKRKGKLKILTSNAKEFRLICQKAKRSNASKSITQSVYHRLKLMFWSDSGMGARAHTRIVTHLHMFDALILNPIWLCRVIYLWLFIYIFAHYLFVYVIMVVSSSVHWYAIAPFIVGIILLKIFGRCCVIFSHLLSAFSLYRHLNKLNKSEEAEKNQFDRMRHQPDSPNGSAEVTGKWCDMKPWMHAKHTNKIRYQHYVVCSHSGTSRLMDFMRIRLHGRITQPNRNKRSTKNHKHIVPWPASSFGSNNALIVTSR